MDAKQQDEQYSSEETQRRMDAALRRALNTPPKPHSEMVGTKGDRNSAARRKKKKKT